MSTADQESVHELSKPMSNMLSLRRRRDKLALLTNREMGDVRTTTAASSQIFENQMLKSQVFGNKHQLRPGYYQKDILGHFGCVNAVEFSLGSEEFLASGGDDKRVLVWKTFELFSGSDRPKPQIMKGRHESNIFCLAFTSTAEHLLSSGNDHELLVHNLEDGNTLDVYTLEEAVYSISIHPDTDNMFVTACEAGRIQLWDRRLSTARDALIIASHHAAFQCAAFNPVEGRLVATANSRDGVQLWDVRRPKWCVMRYNVGKNRTSYVDFRNHASCMSIRWDSRGERIFALRRKEMPALFHISETEPIAYFDHAGYYNSCTMKSCCFAGLNDDYVATGSDNFSVYMWPTPTVDNIRIRKEKTIVVKEAAWELKGHRSIVNQVRFSKVHHMMASSGVEKIVKLWSPWPMAGGRGFGKQRPLYTQQEYLNMVVREGGLAAAQDAEEARGAMDEDPRMLAFFDSLVLREVDNSSSNASSSDSDVDSEDARRMRLVADAITGDSDVEERLRHQLLTRRLQQLRRLMSRRNGERDDYSNEVVESESSSSSDSESTWQSSRTNLSQRVSASDWSRDSEENESESRSDNTQFSSAMSDPEFERHLFRAGSVSVNGDVEMEAGGGLESQQLDPALGYMPTSRPVFERDVTRLVIRKRTARMNNRKRQRASSDPAVMERTSENDQIGVGTTANEDGLTRDEVRRRVEAAVAACRRGQSAAALQRLVREEFQTSTDDDYVEAPPIFRFSSSSSSDEDAGSMAPPEAGRKGRKRKRAVTEETRNGNDSNTETSGGRIFKRRPRGESGQEAGLSSTTSDKQRYYRRRMRSSSSSAEDERQSN